MKRLLVDISQILKANMHIATARDSVTYVEFEGKDVKIPDPHESYELFLRSYKKTLSHLDMTPCQTILVKDGKGCKAMRREFWPDYCDRKPSAPEWLDSFLAAQDLVVETITKYGGLAVQKDGVEADDIIAALAATMESVIWSGDDDMLGAGDRFYQGNMNLSLSMPEIEKKHIVVYKSLVGDKSDNIPGCKNFGVKTFVNMVAKYGDEALDDFLELLEHELLDELKELEDEFLGFKKILDNKDRVYASYKCAKFYHPGWDLEWESQYPCGNGHLPMWEPTQLLVTHDNLTDPLLDDLCEEFNNSPYNSLDIEGYTTEEGKAWCEANKNKQGRKPLDVLGQKITGFSITTGANCHKTYYFSIEHADTNNISLEEAQAVLELLPDSDQGQDIPLVVHNTSFELVVLRMHFDLCFDRGYLPPLLHDTKIMAGYVDEYELSNLKFQSKLRLGYNQQTYEEVTTKYTEKDEPYRVDMNQLTAEEVTAYGCDDTICTGQLYSLYTAIMDYEGTWNCYSEVDVPVQFLYSERFINGIRFDMDKLLSLQEENHAKFDVLYKEIQKYLLKLTWTEELEAEAPKTHRITIADMVKIQAEGSIKKQKKPEYKTITHKWPGCVFEPAKELTPAEIKRLYTIHTGAKLECRARLLPNIAKVIEEQGECTFADCVRDEDLSCLNTLVSESFKPDPQINLRSNADLQLLLYTAMELPTRVYSKVTPKMRSEGRRKGNPSGDESALRHAIVYDLQDDKPAQEFLKTVIDAKSCLTEDSLFLTPYQNMPHPVDGLVHPQFAISAQKSGRGTASGPNDAQVAKDGEVRTVYTPYDENYVWVSMDFSSQEIAQLAVHSRDENLLSCFRGARRDVHSIMGAGIVSLETSMSYEEFNTGRKSDPKLASVRNKKAKPSVFQKNYGGSHKSLAVKLLCSEKEAEALVDVYDKQFPGVTAWQDELKALNRDRGYAVTPLGRRRHLRFRGDWRDNKEDNAGINHPIQGGSGEQVKLVGGRLWKERVYERFDAYFMSTVHDEFNNIVRRDQVLDFIKVVHPMMCQEYAGFDIEFQSSIELGENFGSLREVGVEIDEEAILKVLETI